MTRLAVAWMVAGVTMAFAPAAYAQDLAPPSTGTPAASLPPGTTVTATTTAPAAGARIDPDEKKKDSGRGLEWVYLNADAGFAYTNMGTFSATKLAVQNTPSSGPSFGVGAGVRLFILTLGVRGNIDLLSSYDLWRLDGEMGFHIPLGHWDPYLGLHGGYCFVGSLDDGLSGPSDVSISGGEAGLQLGVDYYFNHFVSLGLEGSGSVLFLHSDSATPALPGGVSSEASTAASVLGDSVGLGVVGSLHLGFHL